MSKRTVVSGRGTVALDLIPVPGQRDMFRVTATNRGKRYPYSRNPIGVVATNVDGSWSHSSAHNPGAGAIYGNYKTALRAAQECYRAHRSWVGY